MKYINLLKEARNDPNIKKAYFPSNRWRLDLNLSQERTRRKIVRCDFETKLEKGIDLSSFMRNTRESFAPIEVKSVEIEYPYIGDSVISTMKQEMDQLMNRNLKDLRLRIQKIHKEVSDDLKDDIDLPSQHSESPSISLMQNEGWMKLLIDPSDEIVDVFNCSRIDISEEKSGIMAICKKTFYILDGYQLSAKENPNTDGKKVVEVVSQEYDSGVKERKRFKYSDVSDIQRRRYLLQPAGLELMLQDGSNLLLVFEKSDRDVACESLLKLW